MMMRSGRVGQFGACAMAGETVPSAAAAPCRNALRVNDIFSFPSRSRRQVGFFCGCCASPVMLGRIVAQLAALVQSGCSRRGQRRMINEMSGIFAAAAGLDSTRHPRFRQTHPRETPIMNAKDRTYDVGGVLLARPFKPRRLGHFALWQSDLDMARRLYVDVLGFRHTDTVIRD